MDTQTLKNFITLAETLHFTKASGQVLIAQPALSRQIRQLEGSIGVELFKRNKRNVALTKAGAYFKGHPSQQDAKLIVVDKNSPATSFLPDTWTRKDEWYNFKDMNPDVHVLIKIDESSYTGGDNGANHPMAWYHEFDGGRAFYTEMGHTEESFAEPLYLKHILGGIQYAIGNK